MEGPYIAVQSREHWHKPDFFHMGHFRVVERYLEGQPNSVISAEFYSDGKKIDGYYILNKTQKGSQGESPVAIAHSLEELSRKSRKLTLAHARDLASFLKLKILDETKDQT